MGNQILLLVLGFVLTTLLGGAVGYYFQKRTWDANRKEAERLAAATVFDEISRAMDQRLYRMRLLYWSLKAGQEERIADAMGGYREVLATWNDNLNRNLALAYRYFGQGVWRYLDSSLYEEFVEQGRHLEEWYRRAHDPAAKPESQLLLVGRRLKALSDDIYYLNRFLVSMIQHGAVGLYQTSEGEGERPPWNRDRPPGSRSLLVARLQRNLNLLGPHKLEVDGWFGRATSEAIEHFQRDHGLMPDGAVDEPTRRKMNELLSN